MTGLRDELRRDRIKAIRVAGIAADIWIRKVAIRELLGVTRSIFHAIPVEDGNGKAEAEVDTKQLVESGHLEEMLEAFEGVALLGVVWGERPNDLADDVMWGDPQEPCLEKADLAALDHEQLVEIGTSIMEFSGMTQEASQLAEHFPDAVREAGGDSAPPASSGVWSETEHTSPGGSS
jgi:hypothetical protein